MKQKVWLTLITCLAYGVDRELYKAIDYLREQVRVLIEQQERDKRILLDNHQRRRLAIKANGLDPEPEMTRKTTWKQFIQSHWSVLTACDFFSVELLVRGRLIRCMVLFAIDLSTRKVEIIGVKPDPNGIWMEQIARNVTDDEDSPLNGKTYLIHDRDPLFTNTFRMILGSAGIEAVKLPPKSPNLNAYAERFVRSVKEKCLSKLILSSENQLRHVLSEYLEYYHHERIHQGVDRITEPKHQGRRGDVICIERLGGLLKSYHRKAA